MQKMDPKNDFYEQFVFDNGNGVEKRLDDLKSLYSSEYYEATARFPAEIYSLYIQHVLLPQIEERRQNGEFKVGDYDCQMDVFGFYTYHGELNEDGKPCGRGVLNVYKSSYGPRRP